MQLMAGMSSQDGKFNPQAPQKGFEITLQKEKDKFFLETGYKTDAVTRTIKLGRDKENEDKFVALKKRAE